jgi:hypothetical protein
MVGNFSGNYRFSWQCQKILLRLKERKMKFLKTFACKVS